MSIDQRIEQIARVLCCVGSLHDIDPDTLVEWGEPMRGPKNSRVVLTTMQCPAWHLYCHEARELIEKGLVAIPKGSEEHS